MAKQQPAPEPAEFPITLAEFLPTITQPESRGAFAYLCKAEGINGHKLASDWKKLFSAFQTKPTGVTWTAWITPGEEGGKP